MNIIIVLLSLFLVADVRGASLPLKLKDLDVELMENNSLPSLDPNRPKPKLVLDLSKINTTKNTLEKEDNVNEDTTWPANSDDADIPGKFKEMKENDNISASKDNDHILPSADDSKSRPYVHGPSDTHATSTDQSTIPFDANNDVKMEEIPRQYIHTYSSISPYYYTSNEYVGYGYGYINYVNLNGHTNLRVMKSLKVNYDNNYIRGILFEYSDGVRTWSYCIGSASYGKSTNTFYFQLGEKITALYIYGVRHGSSTVYFGGFRLQTNQGRTFCAHPSSGERVGPYTVPVGSGVMISAVCRYSGSYIYAAGFQMLNRVERVVLTPSYHSLSSNILLYLQDEQTVSYDNSKGTHSQQYILRGCKKMEDSYQWDITYGKEMASHFEVKVNTRFPVLQPTKSLTTNLQYGVYSSYNRTMTRYIDQCYEFPVTVPAGQTVTVSALLYSGYFKCYFYSASFCYYFDSGRYVCASSQYGYFKGVSPSKIFARVR